MALPRATSDVVQDKFLASTGAVNLGKALLYGCVVTAGADAASITIYDNTAGSGTKVLSVKAAAGSTATGLIYPVRAETGLYAVITGTTPETYTLYNAIS